MKKRQSPTSPSSAPEHIGKPREQAVILGPPASLAEPFRPRPTRMTGVRDCQGWRLKLYEITIDGEALPPAVVDAAVARIPAQVSWPTETASRYGFVILNKGEQALWALVHLWVNDILRQFVFCAPLHDPLRFDASPMPGFNACVWDLDVTRHEREAWVQHVMSSPSDPQYTAYMDDVLDIR